MIVSGNPRIFNCRNPAAWDVYRETPAWEFARFLTLVEQGRPTPAAPPDPSMSAAEANVADVVASLKMTTGGH